jgi:DNA-binding winged helix-turn-helix (wHTH) protein/tetratricopeptide (TPR) repeat protein
MTTHHAHAGAASVANSQVDLAREPDFRLGPLRVRPSVCQVLADGRSVDLQPKVMQVLIVLTAAQGHAVSREELLAACWGGMVVGDDSVHRCIARLRRLSEQDIPGAFTIITQARVGYRLVAGPSGGETVAGDAATPPPAPPGGFGHRIARVSRSRAVLALAAAIVLLLSAGLAARWWPPATAPHRVLAVEPLRAAAGDAPAQNVSLGLSGDLTHALVGNPARIIVDQVGEPGVRAADADLIVSGGVATLGDRLQAHAQLARARGGAILWANDFAGDPSHPDVVREQIATKVDAVINCALSTRHGGAARIGDEANRLYLKACDLIEQYRLDEALQPLRQVTILEPGFARAWADLATTQALTADTSDPTRRAAAYREAAGNARRALALDPRTGLAYYALAQVMPGIANWQRRVETIADGLKVEPDGSELNNAMAKELMRVGRSGEAIAYYRRSMASDPLNPVKTATLITAFAFDGQLDEAEQLIDRSLRLWPRNLVIWKSAFSVELRVGDPKRAEAMLDAADRPALRGANEAEAGRQWLRLRRDPTAKNIDAAVARLLVASSGDPRQDRLPAALRIAEFGQTDVAYRLALGAAGDMDEANDRLLFGAGLSRFREDPRFMVLAARRGLLHIWQVTGAWPDFCATSHRQGCA